VNSLSLSGSGSTVRVARTEEFYRKMYQQVATGIAITDWQGVFQECNPAYCALLGYSEKELTTIDFASLIHPEDREANLVLVRRLQAGEIPSFEIENRYIHKNGEPVWVHKLVSVLHDEEGKPAHLIALVTNITERKLADDIRLRHTAIVKSSDDAIMGLDVNGTVVNWNKGAERLYGYSANEAIGRNICFLSTADDPHDVPNILKRVLKGDVLRNYETVRRRKDGTHVEVSVTLSPIIDAQGAIVGVSGIARDITDRKRADERLRESEAQFRTLAEGIPQLCWMARGDGHIFWYNQRWYTYTGTTPEQMEGWGWQSVHDPQTLPKVLEQWRASISTGVPFDMVFPLRGADGVFRPFLTRVMPIEDADGRVVRWLGTNTDITELRDAQEALRASEERLRLAQWAAHIGTFDVDLRTGVDIWTPETEALYGLPPGGFGGTQTAFENLVHPDDRERIIGLARELIGTGQPAVAEWRVIWPDGSVHWIAARSQVLMDESGAPFRLLGVNMDITESKRAEQALHAMNRALEKQTELLQSQEELLKIFVKNVPAGVAMLDREMRYLQVSDRWCTDYFPGRTQILGRSHYELFPDMPERWKEVHRRALQGETLRASEDYWEGQDGPHWARWEVRPWKTAEGAVGGILILAEDITHRKQMEQALSGMTRKLIESQEQERARIGRELHDDVSQRLALLAFELSEIQNHNDLPSEVQGRLQELHQMTSDISKGVHNLSHELHFSTLDYLGLVSGMRSWCEEYGLRQKLEIDFKSRDVPKLPREISLCLFRVAQEALHNAAKYSGVKRIEVQLTQSSGEIHLIVNDLGKGFDIESARRKLGLGLTSMQERVRLVGGTIVIDSKLTAGTTIHVCVPFSAEHSSQAAR